MAKKRKSGRCIHCLKECRELTSDHVFPESWYPDSTPENIEKWKIPSCNLCNKKYGKVEEDLLLRFGIAMNPTDFSNLGISEKAFKAINPKYGKSIKDVYIRHKKREKFIRELSPAFSFPIESYLPHLEPTNTFQYYNGVAIPLPHDNLVAFAKKLVRGITYITTNRFIEDDYEIYTFFVDDKNAKPIKEIISRSGVTHHRGPGIKITVAYASDDPNSGTYHIEIWGRINIYCLVMPKSLINNEPNI